MAKWKECPQGTDVTGESFNSAMSTGFKTYKQDSGPFVRFLPHMNQRNTKIMGMADEQTQGNFERYDGRETVNQS